MECFLSVSERPFLHFTDFDSTNFLAFSIEMALANHSRKYRYVILFYLKRCERGQ